MKRYAWFAASAVLVLVLIGAGNSAMQPPPPVVATDMAAMPVLALGVQRADRIQIVHRGALLSLERRGQVWCLAQNGGYPVKQAMAARLLDQLLALRLSHPNAPGHTELRLEDPKDPHTTLTGIRVLATNGAGLGTIIVADHDPAATSFAAHQVGDPRDWEATGALEAPADPMEWIDPHILKLDPDVITGATIMRGDDKVSLDAADAAARVRILAGMMFSDIHPAAQVPALETGQMVVTTADGGTLAVSLRVLGDQIWLALAASAPGAVGIPPGAWVFRYPADAAALLEPPS